jgi:hypothetical protein
MEKNQILLWGGILLVLLFILSITTTEGFYKNGKERVTKVPAEMVNPDASVKSNMPKSDVVPDTPAASVGSKPVVVPATPIDPVLPTALPEALPSALPSALPEALPPVVPTMAPIEMPVVNTPAAIDPVVSAPIEMPASQSTTSSNPFDLPTMDTISSAFASPVTSSTSIPSPAPIMPVSAPNAGIQKKSVAPKKLPAPGISSTNIVNGKAPDSSPLFTLTFGIKNGAKDVDIATTAGSSTNPEVGSIQQIASPGADSAAANIQNKSVSGKSVLSPSGLPSDIQTATSTYMPTNPTFRPPASILTAPAPTIPMPFPLLNDALKPRTQLPMPAAPLAQMPMGVAPKKHSKRSKYDSCEDDCDDDCDDCSNEGFF